MMRSFFRLGGPLLAIGGITLSLAAQVSPRAPRAPITPLAPAAPLAPEAPLALLSFGHEPLLHEAVVPHFPSLLYEEARYPQDPADSLYREARSLLNRGEWRKAATQFAAIAQR